MTTFAKRSPIGVRCAPPELFHPVRIDPGGIRGPTHYQARTSKWRRTSPGLFVPSDVDGSVVEQRIIEQASRLTAYGAITAWAALRLHGAAYFDGLADGGRTTLPVPLIVHSKLAPDPAITLTRHQLDPVERTERCGVPVTTGERALFDEMRRRGSLRAAVAAADMAYAADVTSPVAMADYVEDSGPWTGIPLVRDGLALARPGSCSPQETRFRLLWTIDADRPMPLLNPRIVDRYGRYLGKPDLLDVAAGVVGEYDGEHHKDREQHRFDVDREAQFRSVGLEYVTMVAGDPPDVVINRIRSAFQRARWAAPAEREWRVLHNPTR